MSMTLTESQKFIGSIFLLPALFVFYLTCKTLKIYMTYNAKYGEKIKFLFFPILGIGYFTQQSLKKHNDGSYFIKKICRENPSVKAIIVLSGLSSNFIALDNEWVKYLSEDQEKFYKNDGSFAYSRSIGDSLIFTKGQKYKLQKDILNSSFHFEALKSKVHVIKDEAKNFLKNQKPEDGFVKIDIFNETQQITSEVISKTFFNRSLNQDFVSSGKKFYKEIEDIGEDAFRYRIQNPYFILKCFFLGNTVASQFWNTQEEKKLLARINECMIIIKGYVNQSIEQIKNSGENVSSFQPRSFSEVYAQRYLIQKPNKHGIPLEERIKKREIVQQYNAFLFGGTDTTSNLISMTLYALSQNPSVYKKLQQEIDEKVESFEEFNHGDLKQLTYLEAAIKETTRLYYLFPMIFPRRTDKDYIRNDLYISKDLCVQYRIVQFSEKNDVFVNSDLYIPERFLNNPKMDPFDFIPFSSGQRKCIGQNLAKLEAQYILIYILKNFEVKPVPNYQLKMLQFLTNQPIDKELVLIKRK